MSLYLPVERKEANVFLRFISRRYENGPVIRLYCKPDDRARWSGTIMITHDLSSWALSSSMYFETSPTVSIEE